MSDVFECRVRFYANIPRVTHRVVLDGETIGRLYEDGSLVIDDPPTAPQVLRSSMGGAP